MSNDVLTAYRNFFYFGGVFVSDHLQFQPTKMNPGILDLYRQWFYVGTV